VITRIEAYRYRCFDRLAIDIGTYNVLAGANGSGKSTLLDVPALLGDLVAVRECGAAFLERQPSRRVPRAHTLTELIHQGRGDSFTLAIEAKLPRHVVDRLVESSSPTLQRDSGQWPSHLRYEVLLRIFNQELQIDHEYLYLFPERNKPALGGGLQGESPRRRSWRSVIRRAPGMPAQFAWETSSRQRLLDLRVPVTQLALANVLNDPTAFPAALWLQDLLRDGVVFYDPDWDELHQASPPGQPERLSPSARNLAWLARDLQEQNEKRFGAWVEHVRTALPQIERVRAVERADDRYAYFEVTYHGGYEVTSSGLSDGTLRILALTLVPYLSNPPRVLVTEEPENGIHPRAIEAVLQSLASVYGGQVWISTHSPIVLAQTELAELLSARMDTNGAVEVIPGKEHPKLQEWKATLDLGTLFAAGVLD